MRAVPAHKAAFMGHADVMRALAEASGFDDIKDVQGPYNGYTPLHDAVWHGHVDTVRVLLAEGVRTDLQGWDGKTALDLAIEYHYDDIAELLTHAASAEHRTS